MRIPILFLVAGLLPVFSRASTIILPEVDRNTSYMYIAIDPHLPPSTPNGIEAEFGMAGGYYPAGFFQWSTEYKFDLSAIPKGELITSVIFRGTVFDMVSSGNLKITAGPSVTLIPLNGYTNPTRPLLVLGSTELPNYLHPLVGLGVTSFSIKAESEILFGPPAGFLSPLTMEVQTVPAPEPASALLLLGGTALLCGSRQRPSGA